jgi:hypothetical protein
MKKKFVIELKSNPSDEFVIHKQFSDFERAKQSFVMLIKHRSNWTKANPNYQKYRLFDGEKFIYDLPI